MTINEHLMSSILSSIIGTNIVNKTWHQDTVFTEFRVNRPNTWGNGVVTKLPPKKNLQLSFLKSNKQNIIYEMFQNMFFRSCDKMQGFREFTCKYEVLNYIKICNLFKLNSVVITIQFFCFWRYFLGCKNDASLKQMHVPMKP